MAATRGLDRSTESSRNTSALDILANATAIYAGTWDGVLKMVDQGQNWSAGGLQATGIFCLDAWSSVLYAGTYEGQVWSSVNGGGAWSPVGSGLPSGVVRGVVRLGTALYTSVNGGGVFELPDGQTTWTAMNAGLPDLHSACIGLGEPRSILAPR